MTIEPHWIRKNETTRRPRRWVWLDTEAERTEVNGNDVQTWRLAVTATDRWQSKEGRWARPIWHDWTEPAALWEYIDDLCKAGMRTVVMAHNMGYDARISRAFDYLPALGWTLERWQVGDRSFVVRWRKNGAALWLADSTGIYPCKLEILGGIVKIEKPPLPAPDDPEGALWHRCRTDVTILRTAMLDHLAWLRDDDLGNWQPTAGAMAWANWRHKHYTHKVLVHDNEPARAAEREAAYAGRCEAWAHGNQGIGPFVEWDLPLAYPRIALDLALPTVLQTEVRNPSWTYVDKRSNRARWLLYADIRTNVPTLPTKYQGRTLWPVGSFAGWYWDNELAIARNAGASIRLRHGYRYSASTCLADWAAWIIDQCEGTPALEHPLRTLTAKAWARALIGKFGARYRAWEDWGPSALPNATMGYATLAGSGELGRTLSMGGKEYVALEYADGQQSSPAIMSAIMSECRVRLWGLIQKAGPENVLYMDTDSLILNHLGDNRLASYGDDSALFGFRPKASHSYLDIRGPRQLIVGGKPRLSGVKGGAVQVGPNEWAGHAWEGVEAAITAGRPNQVVVRPRSWTLRGTDYRREHLDDGRTAPWAVDLTLEPARPA